MSEFANIQGSIQISADEMEAFLQVPPPAEDTNYTIKDLQDILDHNNIRYGVISSALTDIIGGKLYDQPILVAKGMAPIHGVDGYYEYMFNKVIDNKPQIKADGTVDYWSVNNIESIEAGKVIAIYHPPVQGKDGIGVRGNVVFAKRGKEMPMLKGKGFDRSPDNLVYTASIEGKIEMQNDRIIISAIHEISGNVDITRGNIDFRGDVVVHGNVESGITIHASGSITVDGTVEACTLEAGKDIILRGGMLGGNKASVKTKGNIFAKFFENTHIEAEGSIQADVIMNCTVDCHGKVILSGRRASIIGGEVHAVQGVEAYSIGNEAEAKTYIYTGAEMSIHTRAAQLEKQIEDIKAEIKKIEKGLEQFKALEKEKAASFANDPRRMALLRIRIRDVASLAEAENEYEKVNELVIRAKGATVKILDKVYPGVRIVIDDERIKVPNEAANIEFYRLEGAIRTRPAS